MALRMSLGREEICDGCEKDIEGNWGSARELQNGKSRNKRGLRLRAFEAERRRTEKKNETKHYRPMNTRECLWKN